MGSPNPVKIRVGGGHPGLPKMTGRMRMRSIAAVATVLLLCGCSGTPLTVTNHSTAELHDVRVSGTGFVHTFERIPPGQSAQTHVEPRGESSLHLSFKAGGRLFESSEGTYFESGGAWRVTVEVKPDLSAKVDASLQDCPIADVAPPFFDRIDPHS